MLHRDLRMALRVSTDIKGMRPQTRMGGLLDEAIGKILEKDDGPPEPEQQASCSILSARSRHRFVEKPIEDGYGEPADAKYQAGAALPLQGRPPSRQSQ